jgi:hypothetical protein
VCGGGNGSPAAGPIEPDAVREMLAWENSGFSQDAAVRVAAHDRAGLERLLRYCARPPFALERLERLDAERVVYRKPQAPARWHHGADAHRAGADRPSRGAACSQIGCRPGGTAIATTMCSPPTRPYVRLPSSWGVT